MSKLTRAKILLTTLGFAVAISGCGDSKNNRHVLTDPQVGPGQSPVGCVPGQMTHPVTGQPCFAGTFTQNCNAVGGEFIVSSNGQNLCRKKYSGRYTYALGEVYFAGLPYSDANWYNLRPIWKLSASSPQNYQSINTGFSLQQWDQVEVIARARWGHSSKLGFSCSTGDSVPQDFVISDGYRIYEAGTDDGSQPVFINITSPNPDKLRYGYDTAYAGNGECHTVKELKISVRRCVDESGMSQPCPSY